MSREIKFRMWTGSRMLYETKEEGFQVMECLIQQSAHNAGLKMGDVLGVIPYDHVSDSSSFMQYTGLKDKNGVEIYEGDVISIIYEVYDDTDDTINNTLPAIGYVGWNEYSTGWVIFTKSAYSVNESGTVMTSIIHGDNGIREVIGNIHQNPELLKQ